MSEVRYEYISHVRMASRTTTRTHTHTHTGKADGAVHRELPPRIKVAPEFMAVWDLPDALFPGRHF